MKIINGKKISQALLEETRKKAQKDKTSPCLAVILVGSDPASQIYLQKKEEAAEEAGIKIEKYLFSKNISEKEVLEAIGKINQNKKIDGLLIQLPLPQHLSSDRIIQAISARKDVDGLVGGSGFVSPFKRAILEALIQTGEKLKNKKAVALVNSELFGCSLKGFLKEKVGEIQYLIGPLDNFRKEIKEADIIITALGQPEIVKGEMVKEGVILIDGGISRKNGKIKGDINKRSIGEKAEWLAPVPGGVGPLTVFFLIKNVLLSASRRRK